jgi:hypothetical protein
MDKDWSIFVHLEDPVLELPISQRDMYPGQGSVATTLLEPGQRLVDQIRLQIPATAMAPAELDLRVGLYNFESGERLETSAGQDALDLIGISLKPLSGEMPNPISINFENELELVGFGIDPRRVSRGAMIELILYWKPVQELDKDYTVFAQVVDEATNRWGSQDLPQQTASWPVGEVQAVALHLTLDVDTPPGVYPLITGAYTRSEDGSFNRLQMVTPEGRLTDDFLILGSIRVD